MGMSSEITDSTAIINICQDIDLEQVPELQEEFNKLIEQQPAVLILNFAGSDYICSSCIGLIAKAYKTSRPTGLKFALVKMSPRITKLMKVVCFDQIMTTHKTMQDAISHYS